MHKITINIEALIRLSIIAGLMVLFFHLSAGGNVLNFVHPRMTVFVFAAGFVFMVLMLLQLPAVTAQRQAGSGWWRRLSYLFFLLPLVFGFAYGDRSLSADFAARQGGLVAAPAGRPAGGEQEGPVRIEEKMVFEESNYAVLLYLLYESLDEFIGSEVELTGFVFRNDSTPEGYYAVARYMITCCAADAQIVGVLFRHDAPLAEGEWIRVSGVIEQGERDGTVVPVISIQHIEVVDPLANPYIYF